ncbi:hypothetical protein MBAV_006426 [Candidatus Magnetobacterium bavaricum]|uniref:Uncharacterized protein n=1 Tax=Candidatus Magnetobacterium bavaricum TaxID=29290 RepID=A0A0F3GHT4_9BACT|nr:hypothetical protein MBAV_006426 [Candidatus Magnetobacterium bavaricum]
MPSLSLPVISFSFMVISTTLPSSMLPMKSENISSSCIGFCILNRLNSTIISPPIKSHMNMFL